MLQRYIENPLLLGGYKFHIRVFLYLESIDPPVGYIYQGGQVRKFTSIMISYSFYFLGIIQYKEIFMRQTKAWEKFRQVRSSY